MRLSHLFITACVGVLGGLGLAYLTEPESRQPYCMEAAFKEIGDRQYYLWSMVFQQPLLDGGLVAVFSRSDSVVVLAIASDEVVKAAGVPDDRVVTSYQCKHNGVPMRLHIHQESSLLPEGI